jgi:hypothetical protein
MGPRLSRRGREPPLGAACRIAVCSLFRERVPGTGSQRTARISVVRRKFLARKRFRSARGGLAVFSPNIRIVKEFAARIEQHDDFTTTPLATSSAQIEDTAKYNLSEMAGHDSRPRFVLSCHLSVYRPDRSADSARTLFYVAAIHPGRTQGMCENRRTAHELCSLRPFGLWSLGSPPSATVPSQDPRAAANKPKPWKRPPPRQMGPGIEIGLPTLSRQLIRTCRRRNRLCFSAKR